MTVSQPKTVLGITKVNPVFSPLLFSKRMMSIVIQLQHMMNAQLIWTQMVDYGVQLKQMSQMFIFRENGDIVQTAAWKQSM